MGANYKRMRPLNYLISPDSIEAQEKNHSICIALYNAALNNDWKAAEKIISVDTRVKTAAITKLEETILHVAVGAQNVEFVEKLLKLLSDEDVLLQDSRENTAFSYATASGNVMIAQLLMRKNEGLPFIQGGEGVSPLYLAASFGRAQMASFLYPKTIHILQVGERKGLFLQCINFGIYDLALKMFKEDISLVRARDLSNNTALHILAGKPKAFPEQNKYIWMKHLMKSSNNDDHHDHMNESSNEALKLVRELWRETLNNKDENCFRQIIDTPSKLLFDATESGNFMFLFELIRVCPDLLIERNEDDQTIFHVAALKGHKRIFNLIHEIGFKKDIITSMEDKFGNNLLHLAGTFVASSHEYDYGMRKILQLRQEFEWFKEVKKVVEPYYIEKKNSEGLTAQDLFNKTHKTLFGDVEDWIKSTSSLCMTLSTIIIIGIFIVSFNNNNGPIISGRVSSPLLISSLFASTISLITFSCTLITTYWYGNNMDTLILLFIVGIAALFVSVMTMVVSCARKFTQV
ncbi:uncharacterized protein LOC133030827 isoform X1 [Cannabis sativa]|uniref:uncharacterized protein LOC133030827 isoform X1 n=1 Tax=Cannabis sativa TaxID=3483 RepID=UPI0029C9ED05|nr:uncharacterized protein LOC133030827 isoform X1 [Cannabis sativa]